MDKQEYRRKSKRYPVQWKAAVVFDKADGRPVLHTLTQDLSTNGTAIFSNYGNLTGSLVTLLLAHPSKKAGDVPKMLKIRARVVSTVQAPAMAGSRHGLSFVRAPDDGLDLLEEIFGVAAGARAGTDTSGAAPPAEATASAPSTGANRLAQLRQLAQAKQAEASKPDPRDEINTRVGSSLEKAYRYLKEFTEQFNVVKPAYAKAYSIVGMPNFDELVWQEGHADFHTRETSTTTKVYERVLLNFRLSGNKQLSVTRESPTHEKLNQALLDNKIVFTSKEERNARGLTVRMNFSIPCEIKASLQLTGNFDTGKLMLTARNIERFGILEHLLAPESITDESLDELNGYILGESSRLGPLLLKNV